jgi:hypothetical protein
MKRATWVLGLVAVALVSLGLLCPLYARDGTAGLAKPRWKTGDAWTAKCAEMSYEPSRGRFRIGEYSTVVTVQAPAKPLRGIECYVLEIRPGDDLPEHMRKYSDLIVQHLFCSTSALELVQTEGWRLNKDGRRTWIGRETSTDRHPLPLIYHGANSAWIPPLLPQFPLVTGRSVRYSAAEFRDKETSGRVARGEDVTLSASSDAVTEEATGKDAVAPGARKVSFYYTRTCSRSGVVKEKKAEQIWVPGRPWWSVARLYQGQTVTEFRLAE